MRDRTCDSPQVKQLIVVEYAGGKKGGHPEQHHRGAQTFQVGWTDRHRAGAEMWARWVGRTRCSLHAHPGADGYLGT